MSLPGESPRGAGFSFGFARRVSALSTEVAFAFLLEIVELPGENPAPLAGHLSGYRTCVDLLAYSQLLLSHRHGGQRGIRVQHDVRSSVGIGRHRDHPALVGTTGLELRVQDRLSLGALDFREGGQPSVSLLHRSLDPRFRVQRNYQATDAFVTSLFLCDLHKLTLFQKGKPPCDGLTQPRTETVDSLIRWESSTVVPQGLHSDEVKDGGRLEGRLELAQTTVLGHLDENSSLASRRGVGGAERNDLPAQEFLPVAVLLDLRRLQHEVDNAIRALDDEELPAPASSSTPPTTLPELDTRDELGEELRCIGVDEGFAVAGDALLDVPRELHLLEGRAVVLGELEGVFPDAPREAQAGQEAEPPQELEAQRAGGL